jgi:hypothetical protein
VKDNRSLDASSKSKENGKGNEGQHEKSNRAVAIPAAPTPAKGHKTRAAIPIDPQPVATQSVSTDPATPPAATTPVTAPAPAQSAPSVDSHVKNGKGTETDD